MSTIYLFAGKFSYIVLNKAVYEKVIEMSTKQRQCRNNPDVFRYICGGYIMAKYRFNVRDFTKKAYEAYFGMKFGDQGKSWALHKVSEHYTEMLRFWTQGKVCLMRFGVPMVWREPKNHHDDCYFLHGRWNQLKKKDWYYPDIESGRRPKSHCTEVPVFTSLTNLHCRWNATGSDR